MNLHEQPHSTEIVIPGNRSTLASASMRDDLRRFARLLLAPSSTKSPALAKGRAAAESAAPERTSQETGRTEAGIDPRLHRAHPGRVRLPPPSGIASTSFGPRYLSHDRLQSLVKDAMRDPVAASSPSSSSECLPPPTFSSSSSISVPSKETIDAAPAAHAPEGLVASSRVRVGSLKRMIQV